MTRYQFFSYRPNLFSGPKEPYSTEFHKFYKLQYVIFWIIESILILKPKIARSQWFWHSNHHRAEHFVALYLIIPKLLSIDNVGEMQRS